jgi:SAM-dependent methyltransferase
MAVLDEIRGWWDDDAATYDNAPGHRPRTAAEWAAWSAALARLLPPLPARVLDCGAGTGFLSLIAARLGYQVTAIDLSAQMLDRMRGAAATAGLRIETVEGPADQVPAGHFEAVMERHLLWTLTDPGAVLRVWRGAVGSGGRLVLVEGLWGSADLVERWRAQLREWFRQWQGRPANHHGEYPADVRAELPLAGGTHPSILAELVATAGWRAPRLERLRDVEWAMTLALSPLERLLGVSPRFAIVADAGMENGIEQPGEPGVEVLTP